ncbi:hypothetical protein ZIOFF_011045 [Zingiber officinale]|uniref:Uncharacterized protein n=1 Tax=Zingiber officinale TaxID=94328 RepID=A0A8J5HK11_ZINOF|nr:hypothetical protein ZIOFF_011045 [Zingiber officinale]
MSESYFITKGTLSYKEVVQTTEQIESPVIGFAEPSKFQGPNSGNFAIIKHNNTQLQLLVQIAESLKDIQGDLKTVLEQTRKGATTSFIPDELIDKLKGLSLTEKPKEKKGQLRGFRDPYKILEEEQTKLKKQEEGTMSLIVFRDNRWIGDQTILATMEVDLTQGSQLVYVIPNIMLTIGDFYRNIQVSILTRGYDQWRGGDANLLITRAEPIWDIYDDEWFNPFAATTEDGGEELLAVGIDTAIGPEDGGEELLVAGIDTAAGPAEPVETNMDYPNPRRLMYQQEG